MKKRHSSSTSRAAPTQASVAQDASSSGAGNAYAQEQLAGEQAEGGGGGILSDMMQGGSGPDAPNRPGESSGAASLLEQQTVDAFNAQFRPVLHVLGGTGDGGAVTRDDLDRLFTEDQLAKIKTFLASRSVPQHLFNGVANRPALTPQARIMLASHILATGTYNPAAILAEGGPDAQAAAEPRTPEQEEEDSEQSGSGAAADSAEGELHAESCRHWAMMVYGYAGVGVPGEGTDGTWHTHDPTGAIVLGAMPPDATRGSAGNARSVRRRYAEGGWAPFFGEGIQAADVFHPGDWLQLGSPGGGGHSVVLSEVLRETEQLYWIDYYSQYRNHENSARGLESQARPGRHGNGVRLSKRMDARQSVVFAHHAMSGSRDPESAEDLFEGLGDTTSDGDLASGSPNGRTIRANAPAGATLDEGGPALRWLCETLVGINRRRLDALGDRLTGEQRGLLDRSNVVGNADLMAVEQLVRVNQRVVHIIENDASILANARAPRRVNGRVAAAPAGGRALRGWNHGQTDTQRQSGLLRDMPDLREISWDQCPSEQAG